MKERVGKLLCEDMEVDGSVYHQAAAEEQQDVVNQVALAGGGGVVCIFGHDVLCLVLRKWEK